MRDTNQVSLFSFFETLFTVSFTMVIKWSPGGESAGGWRSTSKSTCVFPAWTLSLEKASSRGSVQASDCINWPLTQRDVYLLKMHANGPSLVWTCLKAIAVPSRRACAFAFVMGDLRGCTHTCLWYAPSTEISFDHTCVVTRRIQGKLQASSRLDYSRQCEPCFATMCCTDRSSVASQEEIGR